MTEPAAPATATAPDQSFPKSLRVLRRSDFVRAQRRGQRVHTAHLTLLLFYRGDGAPARLGLTASRKVGKAHVRNHLKRRVRELFRLHKALFPAGADVLVVFKDATPALPYAALEAELLGALARAARKPHTAEHAHAGRHPPPGRRPS